MKPCFVWVEDLRGCKCGGVYWFEIWPNTGVERGLGGCSFDGCAWLASVPGLRVCHVCECAMGTAARRERVWITVVVVSLKNVARWARASP